MIGPFSAHRWGFQFMAVQSAKLKKQWQGRGKVKSTEQKKIAISADTE